MIYGFTINQIVMRLVFVFLNLFETISKHFYADEDKLKKL